MAPSFSSSVTLGSYLVLFYLTFLILKMGINDVASQVTKEINEIRLGHPNRQ